MKSKKLILGVTLVVVVLAMAVINGTKEEVVNEPIVEDVVEQTPEPEVSEPEPELEPEPVIEEDNLPHDKLFITVERQEYEDGDLQLIIPKLDQNLSVYDGTDLPTLAKGVGLYDYAQLPGEGNKNVSIAGHRNNVVNGYVTDDAPFYYIDNLTEGDYLYLVDNNEQLIYRYLYEQITIVEPDDWGPIYSQGFSSLTITSCHPIGSSAQRIIFQGRLDESFEYSDDFVYLANKEEIVNENEISNEEV